LGRQLDRAEQQMGSRWVDGAMRAMQVMGNTIARNRAMSTEFLPPIFFSSSSPDIAAAYGLFFSRRDSKACGDSSQRGDAIKK
jgi:hypothetical protein